MALQLSRFLLKLSARYECASELVCILLGSVCRWSHRLTLCSIQVAEALAECTSVTVSDDGNMVKRTAVSLLYR